MSINHENSMEFVNRGINFMRQSKYPEAEAEFAKAIEEEPENIDAQMHMGNALVNQGRYDDAILSFNNALSIDPNYGEALFSIGNVYYLMDDYRRAIKFYNKTEAVGYQPVDMYLVMAEIFSNAEDMEQALRCVNRALKVEPLRGDIWRQKVLLLIGMERLDAAQEAIDEFLELLPDALDAYDLQTRMLCAQEQYDEALKRLQPALERFPDDPQVRLVELHIYVESGQNEKAKELIQMMIDNGMDAGVRKRLGMEKARIAIEEDQKEEAVATLEWALEESPEDSQLLYLMLMARVGLLQYQEIIDVADRIVRLDGVDTSVKASAQFYHAMANKELNNTEAAMAEFRKLSKEFRKLTIESPGLSDVYMLRLLCHCQLEEYDKAFALADYLQGIAPDAADGHAYRHLIYKQMGDEEKAAEELAEARKINPDLRG